jgi:hypothetical protein
MYFYLYKITNTINGKIYVGCHSTCNLDDSYFGSGKILRRAIKKYGKENFQFIVLEFFETADDMFAAERSIVNTEFIKRSDTYNINEGGLGNSSSDSKKLWEDPLYREKVLERSLSKFWNDPKHKAKLQEVYQTEKYKETLRAATKVSANEASKILRTSETSKERWQDKSYRENMSKKTGNFMKGTKLVHNIILQQNKKIKEDELSTYLSNGWSLGFNSAFSKKKKPRHKALQP